MTTEQLQNAKTETITHLQQKQTERVDLVTKLEENEKIQHQLLGRLRFIQEALGEEEPMTAPLPEK